MDSSTNQRKMPSGDCESFVSSDSCSPLTRQKILTAHTPPAHSVDAEGIAPKLLNSPNWVCWVWSWTGKKWTKVPVCARDGGSASSTDPSTWSDFATAEREAQRRNCGIGYVFDGDIVGVDLDDCRDPQTGTIDSWASDIITVLGSYSEISPSGTGVKVFVCGEMPEKFDKQYDRPEGGSTEIYNRGRFFTVTGHRVHGTPDDVLNRPTKLATILKFFQSWKPESKPKQVLTSPRQCYPDGDDRETALRALDVLDPSLSYPQWLNIGMALHSVDSSGSMLCEWKNWSRTSDKFNDGECEKRWNTFSGDGVGIGTLCYLADETGQTWRPKRKDDYGVDLSRIVGRKGPFDTIETSSPEGNGVDSAPAEWADPEFLPDDLPAVMDFDYELLPDALRRRVIDIATRMNCPPDFSAVAIIVAAAAVIGRRVTIRPKRYDDWTVVPNLWGCAVGRPGLMKTSAIQQAIVPLRALADDASELHKRQSVEVLATRELMAMKAKRIKKDVQAALDSGEVDESVLKRQLSDARDMEETSGPPLRRYIVMDSTYEACSDMLTETPNGFLQYRDELAGWWASLSRDGQENARSFWLECWNGDGDYYIDRIGRGRVYVPSNTVSVLGATQPGKLRSYLQGAIRGDASDDGMVQRHQMLVWPDASAEWKQVDAWPDNNAKRDVLDVFRRLDKFDPTDIGAIQEDGDDFPYLRFANDAQVAFDEWLGNLERYLRSDQEPPHLESHFSKYRSLVPTLALIFHLIDDGRGPVSLNAIRRAIQWHDYLASHARRAYGGSHGATIDAAKKLLKRIADGSLKDRFSVREVYISHQVGLATREEAQEAIAVLIDFGWLRVTKVKTEGRPSITCQLHPKISVFLLRAGIKSIKSPPRPPFDPFDTSLTPANGDFGRELSAIENEAAGSMFP